MTATYDPKCYDLAALFLSDEPEIDIEARRRELARLIQVTIEDYLNQDWYTVEVVPDESAAKPVDER